VVFEKVEAATGAYFSGRCVAYTTDASGLASVRNKEAKNPADHIILPELISKEPLGPMVRRGDEDWTALVKWTIYGLMEAEEYGVTQANVAAQATTSTDATVQRLLGRSGEFGARLGLANNFAATMLAATGNYGEIFERHLGTNTPLGLERGMNNIWTRGGLLYAPPAR
jgi:general L-amino acid transport system substrate-binding protein